MLVTPTPKYFYIIIMQFLHYFQSASFGMPAITAFWKLQNAMFQVCIWTRMHETLKSYRCGKTRQRKRRLPK